MRDGSEQPRIRRTKASKMSYCLQPPLLGRGETRLPFYRLTELTIFSYFFLFEVPLLDEGEIRNRGAPAATQ